MNNCGNNISLCLRPFLQVISFPVCQLIVIVVLAKDSHSLILPIHLTSNPLASITCKRLLQSTTLCTLLKSSSSKRDSKKPLVPVFLLRWITSYAVITPSKVFLPVKPNWYFANICCNTGG